MSVINFKDAATVLVLQLSKKLTAMIGFDRASERGARVSTDNDVSERVEGAIEVEYMDGAPSEKSFGIVAKMLAPILNGAQQGSAAPSWEWR